MATIFNDSLSVARVFSQYSSSACSYVIPHSAHMDHFNNIPSYQSTFSFKKITPTEVFNAITQLSLSRSAGHDGIESRYIKLASHIRMYPLLTCSTCPYLPVSNHLSGSIHELPHFTKMATFSIQIITDLLFINHLFYC